MLHPVLPPNPPPILESLQPVNPTSSASHTKFLSVVETGMQEKTDKSKQSKDLPELSIAGDTKSNSPLPTPINSTQDDSVVAETSSVPHPPETFPPEISPITDSGSAALLGRSLMVGYPTQDIKTSNGQSERRTPPLRLLLRAALRKRETQTEATALPKKVGAEPSLNAKPESSQKLGERGLTTSHFASTLNPNSIAREKQTFLDSLRFNYRVSPSPLVAQSPPSIPVVPRVTTSNKLVESKAEILAKKLGPAKTAK